MAHYYPQLNEKDITLVQQLHEASPDYLNDLNCPYTENTKMLFRGEVQSRYFTDEELGASNEDIGSEINLLYNRIKEYWSEVKSSDKAADKNTFFRVSTALLEKIIDLKERISRINQVNTFIHEVLAIMDEVLTADQRNEVMTRLERFSTGDKEDEDTVRV